MKRFFLTFAAAIVLCVCVIGIVLITRQQIQSAAVRRQIADGPANLAREEAAARREGIPLTAQELQRPLPPPSENAAPLYVKLTALLREKPLGLPKYAESIDAFHSYTPAQIAAVRRTLAARQDVMTLVHQAADKPQCVFVRDWNKGLDLTFLEYPPMRYAARLLKTESYLLAEDGQYQAAIRNQSRGFRIARHAASDSVILSYLVGNSCELITLSGMQSILAQAGPNAALSRQVQQSIRLDFVPLSLHEPFANEAAAMSVVFQQLHAGQHQGLAWLNTSLQNLTSGKDIDAAPNHAGPPVSAAEQKIVSNAIDSQQANYLADVRRITAAVSLPIKERRAAYAALLDPSSPSAKNGARTLSFILLPDCQNLDNDVVRLKTREVMTLAAAAVLAAKAQTGTFPATLLSQFTDPFMDKPLIYRREGAGFVVYSVGPASTFRGGKPGGTIPLGESAFRYPPTRLPITADMLK